MTMPSTTAPGAGRAAVFGVLAAAAVLVIYWFAAQAGEADFTATGAVLVGLIGLATGAALGAVRLAERWTTWEAVLVTALAVVCGIIFWSWGLTVWNLVRPLRAVPGIGPGLRDLFYGAWFLPAVLVPYIVRRPGSAVVAELIAAVVSAFIGTEWGLTVLISGLAQGGLAELVFAAGRWQRFGTGTLMLAGAAAGIGSFLIDVPFWYSDLGLLPLMSMFVARIISGAVLAGLVGKLLADGLAKLGVLDNVAIRRQAAGSGR